MTIGDDGPGISAATHARLFREPFFTTKPRHRGLGLAVAYRCAAAHGGGVRLDPPAPGTSGVVARLALPIAPARLHADLNSPRAAATPPRPSFTTSGK